MPRHLENGDAQNAPRQAEKQLEIARETRVQDEARQGGEPRRMAAGEWLRVVAGFSAPFGHDGMPTVWG